MGGLYTFPKTEEGVAMNEDTKDPKVASVGRYNDEAEQVYLKALRGCEGEYRRYESRKNIADVVESAVNDNNSH